MSDIEPLGIAMTQYSDSDGVPLLSEDIPTLSALFSPEDADKTVEQTRQMLQRLSVTIPKTEG